MKATTITAESILNPWDPQWLWSTEERSWTSDELERFSLELTVDPDGTERRFIIFADGTSLPVLHWTITYQDSEEKSDEDI